MNSHPDKNRIRTAFEGIRADDALLQKTADSLRSARARREGNPTGRARSLRLAGSLAAVLLLLVGALGYQAFYATAAAAAYVGIDVNPSVELTLNRHDDVIAAAAYDAQGQTLLQQADVTGKPYDEAVSALLGEMLAQGHLSADALVTLTVQAADSGKEQLLCEALLEHVRAATTAAQAPADVEVFPVTQQVRESARGCHMSAAKYLAIQELMEVDDTATLEEYGNSTIRQIRQRTQACRNGHAGNGGGQGGGNGQGSGNGQGNGHGNGHGHGKP